MENSPKDDLDREWMWKEEATADSPLLPTNKNKLKVKS